MKRFFLGLITIATLLSSTIVAEPPVLANNRNNQLISQGQSRPEIKLSLAADKQIILTENGQQKPSWQPLSGTVSVKPGDRLRYRLVGRNDGTGPAQNLVLNQAIPGQMAYITGSVQAPKNTQVLFSIDGGKSFTAKPMVKVKQLDGRVIDQPAKAEAYSHIRWILGTTVAAKATVTTSYELRVR